MSGNGPTTEVQPKAQQALRDSSHPALRHLSVQQTPVGLLISGSVPSFYFKQLAQETVRAVNHDVPIVNSIHVTSPPGEPS